MSTPPKVSIGLPVYNGERLIGQALDSLLAQSLTDFEVIISDNGSDDRTGEICRQYVQKDSRIQYHRQAENLGAARNFNFCFARANGTYFKWLGHDDTLEPGYVQNCVEVLDRYESVVLAFPKRRLIDSRGQTRDTCDYTPHRRAMDLGGLYELTFVECMWLPNDLIPPIAFGMMRRQVLGTTRLIGNYVSSDLVLAAEMCLRGRVVQVPQRLFNQRVHDRASWRANLSLQEEAGWFDPANLKRTIRFPDIRIFMEYIRAVRLSGQSFPRKILRCLQTLIFPLTRGKKAVADAIFSSWSWFSLQCLAAAEHNLLPLRAWALVRMLRRGGWKSPGKTIRQVGQIPRVELIASMACAVAPRKERRGQKLLMYWLDSSDPDLRRAAVRAFGTDVEYYGDLLRARLPVEKDDIIRKTITDALGEDDRNEQDAAAEHRPTPANIHG